VMQWLVDFAPYIIAALQILAFLGFLVLSKHFASRTAQEKNEHELQKVNLRLTRVEDAVEKAPSHGEIRQLERQLGQVSSDIKRLEPSIKQLSNHVDMLFEKELNKK